MAAGKLPRPVDGSRHRGAAADDVVEAVACGVRLRSRLRRPRGNRSRLVRDDQHGADGAAIQRHRVQPFRPPAVRQARRPLLYRQMPFQARHAFADADGTRDAAGRVHQPPGAVERDQARRVAAGNPLQADLQQPHPLLRDLLAQRRFDLPGGSDGEGQVGALIGRGRPGDVDHAEDFVRSRLENRRPGAGPAFDALAEMLRRVHLRRPPGGQRGADAVGADDVFAPVAAGHQVDALSLLQGPPVADGIQHDAVGIGQHHDRVRAGEQFGDFGEYRGCRRTQIAAAFPQQMQGVAMRADAARRGRSGSTPN